MDISNDFWPFVRGVLALPYEILVTTPQFQSVQRAEMGTTGIVLSLDVLAIPPGTLSDHPCLRGDRVVFDGMEHAITVLVPMYESCGRSDAAKLLVDCLEAMVRRARLNDAIDELEEMGLG